MDEKKQAVISSNKKTAKGILKKTDSGTDIQKKSVNFNEEIGIQLIPARRQPYIKKTINRVMEYAASLSYLSNSSTNQIDKENKLVLIAGSKTDVREFADENPRMKDLLDQSKDRGPFKLSVYLWQINFVLTQDLTKKEFDSEKSLIEQIKSHRPDCQSWPLWETIGHVIHTYEEFKPNNLAKNSYEKNERNLANAEGKLLLDILRERSDIELVFCYNEDNTIEEEIISGEDMDYESVLLREIYHDPGLQKKVSFYTGEERMEAPWKRNPELWKQCVNEFGKVPEKMDNCLSRLEQSNELQDGKALRQTRSIETNLVRENKKVGTTTEKQKLSLLHHKSAQTSSTFSFAVPEKKNLKGTIEQAIKEVATSFNRKVKEVERAKIEK